MKLNKEEKMFYLNAVLMTLVFLISNVIVQFSFEILGVPVLLSVFTYPFVFYFANQITKNNGEIKTVIAIIVALVVQLLAFVAMSSYNPDAVGVSTVLGSLIAFAVAQLVNLLFYSQLAKPKRGRKVKILELLFIYVTAVLVDSLVFAYIVNAGLFTMNEFYALLAAIALKGLVAGLAAILDKNAKKVK